MRRAIGSTCFLASSKKKTAEKEFASIARQLLLGYNEIYYIQYILLII
jgi:hypothetical protein